MEQPGTVIAIQANYYRVRLLPVDSEAVSGTAIASSLQAGTVVLCTRRARLKKVGARILAGDRVRVAEIDPATGRGVIVAIAPRQTELDRPPVANADRILLLFALSEPELDPKQLSRFLLKAESTRIPICLCLSKCDLVSAATQQAWQQRLTAWGYPPLIASVTAAIGLDALLARLAGRTTIVAGPSGVGKSSAIDKLIPAASLRVGAVSGKLGRGRHTTRHVELFELPEGGLLADTPGFNQPNLTCQARELPELFPEIRARLQQGSCRFSDCQHRHEPGCVVRGDWERYAHYLELLDELSERHPQREAESSLKLKVGRRGQQQYEPKLALKKYRRTSRRQQQQSLQDLRLDVNDSRENTAD